MDNWIFKYHEAIQKKEVIVGVWVRLCFEILTTGLLNGEWEFNEKKSEQGYKIHRKFLSPFRGTERPLHLNCGKRLLCPPYLALWTKQPGIGSLERFL